MFVEPENMGLDTLFVQLCAILAKIIRKNIFIDNGGTNLHTNDTWDILLNC